MSSSSPATGSDSRSSSPHTPSPEPHPLDPVGVHSDFGAWYQSDTENILSPRSSWLTPALQTSPQKYEDTDQILHLDDLIQRHAYEDPPSPLYTSPEPLLKINALEPPVVIPSHLAGSHPVLENERVISNKPVPSVAIPEKRSLSTNPKVVFPPRESCYNLSVQFPSLPEGGTKSRVETQVRLVVDLVDPSSSSDAAKCDRVGSWNWLQLPRGTATKRRTRKQGKIDPRPEDILHLSATVTCASAPHNPVYSCTSCQTREAKRLAKKMAARVRPTRSDSDSGDDPTNKSKKQREDTNSILQFNCAEVQEFSTGSAVLPLRITCYCRHHREKVGFNIHFVMMDHAGRIVGAGVSTPIMITDDHKTPGGKNVDPGTDLEYSRDTKVEATSSTRAPSKRKKDVSSVTGTKRAKPYDIASKPNRRYRETSAVDSLPSPSTSYPGTRSPTPNLLAQPVPQLQQSSLESDSSGDAPATPPDYPMLSIETQEDSLSCQSFVASVPTMSHTLPFSLFDATRPPPSLTIPTIHRLIPNSGPTHGGTEVTILGANFHPSLQLNCVFGDVIAGSTQRWSDNTLVCILPPRATPGVVPVWFSDFPKMDDSTNSANSLFTYSDESDRALMELALQVVGLKMTGKIEDAKNVAMRIVGNVGGGGSGMQASNTGTTPEAMQVASSLNLLLLGQPTDRKELEVRIIKFLSLLETPIDLPSARTIHLSNAIDHPTSTGQTLLHLASFLGFDTLVRFLIILGADLDARDRSGCTALHFASIVGSAACVETLLRAGADSEIVDARGKTPQEVAARDGLFDVYPTSPGSPGVSGAGDDEEAHWGDAEEDSDDSVQRNPVRRLADRRRRSGPSGKRTPRHVVTSRSSSSSLVGSAEAPANPKAIDDEKQQAATFLALIQRTLAQLPAPQLRNLPGLPQLPEMPAVPWGALPQLPMVFPVFVPWPAFLARDAPGGEAQPRGGQDEGKGIGAVSTRAAQEQRGTWEAWEKWLQLALAGNARPREETPPPMYTPRETPAETTATPAGPANAVDPPAENMVAPEAPSSSRHVRHDAAPSVSEQEVNAFGHVRFGKQKKHDRMLMFFWLPILLISLLWAAHSGVRMALHTFKATIPLETGLRT